MLEATREADDADGVAEAETVVATVWFEFRSEVFINLDEKVQERTVLQRIKWSILKRGYKVLKTFGEGGR